jgi:hypothetical protein
MILCLGVVVVVDAAAADDHDLNVGTEGERAL